MSLCLGGEIPADRHLAFVLMTWLLPLVSWSLGGEIPDSSSLDSGFWTLDFEPSPWNPRSSVSIRGSSRSCPSILRSAFCLLTSAFVRPYLLVSLYLGGKVRSAPPVLHSGLWFLNSGFCGVY